MHAEPGSRVAPLATTGNGRQEGFAGEQSHGRTLADAQSMHSNRAG